MNANGYRINGGIGCAIDQPQLEVCVGCSDQLQIIDTREVPLSHNGIDRLENRIREIQKLLGLKNNISVVIRGNARTHFGFGTGTAIRLATLEGLLALNQVTVDRETLVRLSGRGRTSGIGVNTYFDGGLVLDWGHKSRFGEFLPSSRSESYESRHSVFQRLDVPAWEIGIVIPRSVPPISDEDELRFFHNTCPISPSGAYEALYHATYGLWVATLEDDRRVFEEAISKIQECAWKSAERALYGKHVEVIEAALMDCGASAVGMSSIGPSLFFLGDNLPSVKSNFEKTVPDCEIVITRARNTGRLINYV